YYVSRLSLIVIVAVFSFIFIGHAAAANEPYIYDEADLLTETEEEELAALAEKNSEQHETDFLILTTKDVGDQDVEEYMGDFYDDTAPGYDQPHGNTVLFTLDMQNREMYLAGFQKGEEYLSNERIELVLDQVFPLIAEENYAQGFGQYITTASDYMRYKPGVNPENPFYTWWVQLGIAVLLAGAVVFFMAYRSGGKVTTTPRTYMDHHNTKVNRRRDRYVNRSVTRRKKPENNNKGGDGPKIGGGGGGMTGGGRSFSGGRRSF